MFPAPGDSIRDSEINMKPNQGLAERGGFELALKSKKKKNTNKTKKQTCRPLAQI